jgi:hypothetical protein
MTLTKCRELSINEQVALVQLTNTGQVDFAYSTNPTGGHGGEWYVFTVRDEHGTVVANRKEKLAGFASVLRSMQVQEPAPATLDGHPTYQQMARAGAFLEYFDVVAMGLRGTSPSTVGRHLDTWDRRREGYAREWDKLDATDRRLRLAEVRAVLAAFHQTDAEREVHVTPSLAELAGREQLNPTGISNSVRR